MQDLFTKGINEIDEKDCEKVVHEINEVKMIMPLKVGDFTDFSSSKNHA